MFGKNTHRWKQNPLEEKFAKAWAEQNEQGRTLEYILSTNIRNRPEPVSEEIQVAVATTIQWLGSPVGQSFLEDVLGVDRNEFDQKR